MNKPQVSETTREKIAKQLYKIVANNIVDTAKEFAFVLPRLPRPWDVISTDKQAHSYWLEIADQILTENHLVELADNLLPLPQVTPAARNDRAKIKVRE